MALVGISKAETIEYVSDDDPCKTVKKVPIDAVQGLLGGTKDEEIIVDGATKFTLGTLDVFLMGMIYDRASTITRDDEAGAIGMSTKLNSTAIDACRYGLRAWENFQDAQGSDLKLTFVKKVVMGRDYQAVTDDCLASMGIRLVAELGNKIKEISNVTRADTKNSAAAS